MRYITKILYDPLSYVPLILHYKTSILICFQVFTAALGESCQLRSRRSYWKTVIKILVRYRLGSEAGGSIAQRTILFVQGRQIHQGWRLYPDELDAFVITVIPNQFTSNTTFVSLGPLFTEASVSNIIPRFSVLSNISHEGIWKYIAFPSQLYAEPSENRPLAGARIGLQGCYHLAGILDGNSLIAITLGDC